MKLSFINDIVEISESAYIAFLSTLPSLSDDDASDLSDASLSSDIEQLDLSAYGCNDITKPVERMVEANYEVCKPLEGIFGTTEAKIIKETLATAEEETQCVGLNLFKHITSGEDRNLIATCTTICYWCCCETIKKTSPIIAKATLNLLI